MKNAKSITLLLTGAVLGATLTGPTANAAEAFFQATPTLSPIYVDGRQIQMEAYVINGSNYVKLRDIGKAVDLEVYWDGSAVQVLSDRPYTGQPPAVSKDYSAQGDPAVFTGYLTRDAYNTIREAVLMKQTTSFGPAVTGFIGLKYGDDEVLFQRAEQETQQIQAVLAALGPYPDHQMVSSDSGDEYLCQVRYAEDLSLAAEHTRDFIASLTGSSDREKIRQIDWYVCDRIAYDKTRYAWPSEALTQDGIVGGACMSYAYSFQFLCQQAGIPCVLKHGDDHQWNTVYAEGRWWDVDVTADDCDGVIFQTAGSSTEHRRPFDGTDEFRARYYVTSDRVLREDSAACEDPEITRFAQEVLVPGSTR